MELKFDERAPCKIHADEVLYNSHALINSNDLNQILLKRDGSNDERRAPFKFCSFFDLH